MKCLTLTETDAPTVAAATDVRLPMGLLGFEHLTEYMLLANPGEEPFHWLQVKDNNVLAFIVVNPFFVAPDYKPDLPQTDVDFLSIKSPDDVLLFNIVTLHNGGRATINLKGPLVLNRHTMLGKQVVIANASEYAVQHPLPLAEANA